jgi:hypothetical protein
MSTMTRSAYGLDSGTDNDWWRRSLCAERGRDREAWVTAHGGLTADNREARRLCDQECPVRTACRDDMLNPRTPRPCQEIRAGWWWKATGQPDPNPDDAHLLPPSASGAPPKPSRNASRTGRAHQQRMESVQRLLNAGRMRLAGESAAAVALRCGYRTQTVHGAARILLYGADLVPLLEAGRMTIDAALQVVRERRDAAS